MKVTNIVIIFSLIFVFIFNCSHSEQNKPAKGTLQITWEFANSAVKTVVPSYQTAIWLTNDQGEYIKSILVSEFLSYGGYHETEICGEWSKVAGWDQVLSETFDAVTKATPQIGLNTINIKCKSEKILPGTYNYYIETHILDKYNILYHGQITIGKEPAKSIAEPVYIPEKHPDSGDILKNVTAIYKL